MTAPDAIDLIVVGGGPVGLAAAIGAARAGMSVVVIERRTGPIDKSCGEGLMPGALAALGSLGVDPAGAPIAGIRYSSGLGSGSGWGSGSLSRSAVARFSDGPGRGVRRTVLHAALLERALDLGVRILTGRVGELEQFSGWVQAGGFRGRYLIGADGLHSSVRRAVGLQADPAPARRFGVRQHFRVRRWSDLVEVHWLRDREVYVTPVSEDLVGVAVLGPAPLDLGSAIGQVPSLVANLHHREPASAPLGAGPFRQSTTARVAGRVLLVGDAAGYVDALTGEGLRIGLEQAAAVVSAVAADRPHLYEGEWKRITRTYARVTNGLLWAGGKPALRRMIVPSAHALPGTFTRVVDLIAR